MLKLLGKASASIKRLTKSFSIFECTAQDIIQLNSISSCYKPCCSYSTVNISAVKPTVNPAALSTASIELLEVHLM